MMKKNFDINILRRNYFKNFISYNQFLTMKSNVIFSTEFRQFFMYENNSINIVYENKIKFGQGFEIMKYPFVIIFANNKKLFSIRGIEFQSLSYIEFLDELVKYTSNDFIDNYYKSQKIQMNLGDYGL